MLSLSSIAVIIGSLTAWTAALKWWHVRQWDRRTHEDPSDQ
jgi:hypothetical protein